MTGSDYNAAARQAVLRWDPSSRVERRDGKVRVVADGMAGGGTLSLSGWGPSEGGAWAAAARFALPAGPAGEPPALGRALTPAEGEALRAEAERLRRRADAQRAGPAAIEGLRAGGDGAWPAAEVG